MSTAAKTPNYNLSQVVGSDIPDWITDYTSDMGKIDAALKENADDVDVVRPDEFSEESTYAAGDYCIKNNVIYKAKTAVAAGAFDVSDWEATSIFKELSALTNKMGSIVKKVSSYADNVESISVDLTQIGMDYYTRFFTVTFGMYNEKTMNVLIGAYRYTNIENECDAIIYFNPGNTPSVTAEISGSTLTVSWNGNISHARITAFDC